VSYLNIKIGWYDISIKYDTKEKEVLNYIKRLLPLKESRRKKKYLLYITHNKPHLPGRIKIRKDACLYFLGNKSVLYLKSKHLLPIVYHAIYIFASYIHAKNNACIIHGAGITKNQCGFVFAGRSGTGKTTIANKINKKNILNDEAVAVKEIKSKFFILSTPFGTIYNAKTKPIPLKAIFLIKKHYKVSITDMKYPRSIPKIYEQIQFLHHFSKDLRKRAFVTSTRLCGRVPIYELKLTKYADILQIIKTLKLVSE